MSERDIIDSLSKLSLRFAEGFLFFLGSANCCSLQFFLVWLHSLTFRYMFVLLCINTRFSIELPEAEPSKAPLRIMQLCGKPQKLLPWAPLSAHGSWLPLKLIHVQDVSTKSVTKLSRSKLIVQITHKVLCENNLDAFAFVSGG